MRTLSPVFVLVLLLGSGNRAHAQYKLYGTTNAGGDSSAGVLFSIYSDGSHYQRLYSFKGGTDGNGPDGPLAMGTGSKIYGLTAAGGASGGGIVFAYDTLTHVYHKVADLSTSTGFDGVGGLVWFHGKFYGLGVFGGAGGNGTIFTYVPGADSVTDVYDLATANGAYPFGSMTVLGNLLYFTTNSGGPNNGGVLNVYDPASGTATALYNFPSGSGPWSSLTVMNSVLYGVASFGGPNHLGEIYAYHLGDSAFTDIFDYEIFDDGVYPYGVVPFHGLLYGSTANGGTHQTGGTLNYTNTKGGNSQFYSFDYNNDPTDGGFPYGVPIITPDSLLLGMTERGGSADSGIIYRYDLRTSTFTKLLDFTGPNGSEPIMNALFLPRVPVAVTGSALEKQDGDSLRLINTVVTGTAYLQYTTPGSASTLNLRVVSMGGQILIQQQLPVSVGVNSYSIDASALPKGMYVLQAAGRSIQFIKL